jgi:hypothetical protein
LQSNLQKIGGFHHVKEYIDGKQENVQNTWGIDGYF